MDSRTREEHREAGIHFDDETVFFRSEGCFLTAESAFLIAGAVGKIDTVGPSYSLAEIHAGSSSPAPSRASHIGPVFSVLLRGNIDEEKRNICAFMTASPLSLAFHRKCALGVAAFRIRISLTLVRFLLSTLVTPSFNPLPPLLATLTFYCRIAVLAWIISVIHILAEIKYRCMRIKFSNLNFYIPSLNCGIYISADINIFATIFKSEELV